MKENKKNNESKIQSACEKKQEIDMTMDEIVANEKPLGETGLTDDEVKVATDRINPDEASMDSRG
ncbi:MAG: hypothetical protein LBP67_04575 [Bacteroidales bacterium]|jgi:hypothetical protein|nr:hypothetical protein [Bacteroidales bacterium]